jgi:hypothetical protein
MKKLLTIAAIATVLVAGAAPVAVYAEASAGQPDNFGQCHQMWRDFGMSPSQFAPGQSGQGPANIIYNNEGDYKRVHWPQKPFFAGIACDYVPQN